MFCKWCGNNIQLTDKKCPSCGRETPPMSDCGGFYNLKHSSNGAPTPIPTPAPPKPVVIPQCPVVDKMEPKYTRDRKAARSHHTVTMICFVIVLVAIVCSTALVVRLSSQLAEIKEQISGIQSEGIPPTEDIANETTEPHQVIDPLEPVPYVFTLGVTVGNAESTEIGSIYDFGEYAQTAKVIVSSLKNEKEQDIAVSYILDGEETAIKMDLAYGQDESENLIISVKCNSDLALFDDQDFTYEWQYRNSIGSWTAVEKDMVSQDDEDYICFACNPDWLKNVCFLKQPVELRCNIQIKNGIGDSMLLTVDGISIAPDGTLVTNDQ